MMAATAASLLLLFSCSCEAAVSVPEAIRSMQLARYAILAEQAGVRIAPSSGKGLGIFATRRLGELMTVGNYAGEQLTQRDIDVRFGQPPRSHALWSEDDEGWYTRRESRGVACTGDYIFKVGDDLYIDGEDCSTSNWTRFLNHGEPNLRVKSLLKGMDGKPRVWFVALRDIEIGEELLWDYGESYWKAEDVII
uniref:SET domain-containing protein n=1 Tax=Coccolithus braarudii TaxID=221442 RepID=A0A7S0L8E2_9EUKA|mmetsp:Transcript_26202/g.56547  ORF Transcript_26202/g.56547 Transcript_26202/m.56547 type:complete len:194 (+) Transcript_26202:3-584(+)